VEGDCGWENTSAELPLHAGAAVPFQLGLLKTDPALGCCSVDFLRHFALDAHFVAVHGCELDGTREDKRDLLAHLLPHHGIDAREAVMIGDRGVDMIAARHHGVQALGALWGYGTREELEAAGAQRLCALPREIPAHL